MEETFREDRIYVGTKQIFNVSFIVFKADGKEKKKSGGFLNAGKNGRKRRIAGHAFRDIRSA
jgi:hypothetical protein